MKLKQITKKLNSQKGATGADVVLALLIIMTTVMVIAMVYSNLVISSRSTDRKTGASRIATNIIENMSQFYYDDIPTQLSALVSSGIATQSGNTYTISGGDSVKAFSTSIPSGYTVSINFENSYGSSSSGEDVIKLATITVEYPLNGITQTVEYNKVFERDVVRECNSPNFSDDYISTIIGSSSYEMYSTTASSSSASYIICPIKYNASSGAYEYVTDTDEQWYSYSNKQWARILVLSPSAVSSGITSTNLKGSNSYVWIPRYGSTSSTVFGNTYFKYKTTDLAIKNVYSSNSSSTFLYNYFDDSISWYTGIGIETEGITGVWVKYTELTSNTYSSNLNSSQYGPLREY